jgi:hypothetical protein
MSPSTLWLCINSKCVHTTISPVHASTFSFHPFALFLM